jgi:drug/metabolite transporter (DMT)-like permease
MLLRNNVQTNDKYNKYLDQAAIKERLTMTFEGYQTYSMVVVLVAMLIAIPLAFTKNTDLHEKTPEARPFKWGYFGGFVGLIGGGLLLLLDLFTIMQGGPAVEWATISIVYTLVVVLVAYWVLQRKKWAWVVFTIMQINPIMWIINGIYGARRWKEMD